jgi:hypothetical protein
LVSNYGTEKLSTIVPTDGIWRDRTPANPNDFVYGNKLPWFRDYPVSSDKSSLIVTGRRLDGMAPSFTIYGGAFDPGTNGGMMMGFISIPVFGCWEITAHYTDQDLTFVVLVTPLLVEAKTSCRVSSPQDQSPPHHNLRKIQVDRDVQKESLVYEVTPEVPHEAQVIGVSVTVLLHAVIDEEGRVRDVQYVSGPPLLTQAAIDAVRWWQ